MDLSALIFAALKSAKTANERIDNLPDPLVPRGTLGTGTGDLPDLPSNANIGDTYFVATAGTYDGISARVGDMFFYNNNSTWSYIPTGDVDTWRNVFVNGTEVQGIDNKDALKLVDSDSVKVNYDGTNKAVSFEGLKIMSFTYTGTGTTTNEISFPTKPSYILSITGNYYQSNWSTLDNLPFNSNVTSKYVAKYGEGANTISVYGVSLSFDENNNKLTITADSTTNSLNYLNRVYTVNYI